MADNEDDPIHELSRLSFHGFQEPYKLPEWIEPARAKCEEILKARSAKSRRRLEAQLLAIHPDDAVARGELSAPR